MTNFIPMAFASSETTCPVCLAREALETAQSNTSIALIDMHENIAAQIPPSAPALQQALQAEMAFEKMLSDYRVAFAINLAIWFSAERFGRTRKVPDLILAYEEYRQQALLTFSLYEQSISKLISLLTEQAQPGAKGINVQEFSTTHANLIGKNEAFWLEVDKWTQKRRDDAFKLL